MNATEVRELLRHAIKAEGSQLAYSLNHEVDRATLACVLSGKIPIPPKVLTALKVRKVITYEKE